MSTNTWWYVIGAAALGYVVLNRNGQTSLVGGPIQRGGPAVRASDDPILQPAQVRRPTATARSLTGTAGTSPGRSPSMVSPSPAGPMLAPSDLDLSNDRVGVPSVGNLANDARVVTIDPGGAGSVPVPFVPTYSPNDARVISVDSSYISIDAAYAQAAARFPGADLNALGDQGRASIPIVNGLVSQADVTAFLNRVDQQHAL